MASNKTGMKGGSGTSGRSGLGGTLLSIVAVGVGGGALLIASSKAVGEKLLKKQQRDCEALEARREADKEEVRRITENSTDSGL